MLSRRSYGSWSGALLRLLSRQLYSERTLRKNRERYRDLLQASTSILDISRASKRVSEALDETKITIIAQDHPSTPRKNAFSGESGAFVRYKLVRNTSDFTH